MRQIQSRSQVSESLKERGVRVQYDGVGCRAKKRYEVVKFSGDGGEEEKYSKEISCAKSRVKRKPICLTLQQ